MDPDTTGQDWFSAIAGFPEEGYAATQAQLAFDGQAIINVATGRRRLVGSFEIQSLASLRARTGPMLAAARAAAGRSRTTLRLLEADVRELHARPAFAGALFQVASQFNALEMVSPGVTPEDGISIYAADRTQGPACAMAAGAATIFRNYLVSLQDGVGQSRHRQIDTLARLGAMLARLLRCEVSDLWRMHNGYALCTEEGLGAIERLLREDHQGEDTEALRGQLEVAVQRDTEVTDVDEQRPHLVDQVFCSALPVSYTRVAPLRWAPFATLVLEAAYEATLLAAVEGSTRGRSRTVVLTSLGGGAFGNDPAWIVAAIERALWIVEGAGLDVRLNHYGSSPRWAIELARRWSV